VGKALASALGSEAGSAALVAALGGEGGRNILLRALRTPAGRGLLQEVLETEEEAVAPVVDALVDASLGRLLAGAHGADLVGRVPATDEGKTHIQDAVKAEFDRLKATGRLQTVSPGSLVTVLPPPPVPATAQPREPPPAAASTEVQGLMDEIVRAAVDRV
jgi:hypothetical protein